MGRDSGGNALDPPSKDRNSRAVVLCPDADSRAEAVQSCRRVSALAERLPQPTDHASSFGEPTTKKGRPCVRSLLGSINSTSILLHYSRARPFSSLPVSLFPCSEDFYGTGSTAFKLVFN